DPEVMIISVGNRSRAEGLPSVGTLKPIFVSNVNDVRIIRINSQRVVIKRPGDQASRRIDETPRTAAVLRAVEPGAVFGLNQRIDTVGIRRGDRNVRPAEEFMGKSVR